MSQTFFNSTQARELIDVYGFAIFPVHGVVDGQCTCNNPDCKNKGKHPATPNGFQDASKDIERVKEMWAGRKGLNVGIATGAVSGIFVIDIDGPTGVESINAMIEEYGPLPTTLTSQTANGHHLIFKHPGGIIRSRGQMLPKVDVRGDGGYIVGPYSNHASGKKYGFVNPLETVSTAPKWLIDLVIKENKPTQAASGLQIAEYHPKSNILSLNDRRSEEEVERMLGYISPDLPYQEWFQIGMAIKDYGLPFDLWDRWSARGSKYVKAEMPAKWNSFKGTGVSLGTIVYYAQQGGWKPETIRRIEPIVTKPPVTYDAETGEIHEETENQAVNGLFYLRASQIKPSLDSNDFVQGLLSESALSVIYGPSNCGKTFFVTDLCFHVALGRRWRDKRVNKGGVVYVALEGSAGLLNRVAAFSMEREQLPDNFTIVPCQVNFLAPDGNINDFIELLKIAAKQIGSIKLVVIDTLARAMAGGDENAGQDMGMLVHHADRIRAETGAHVCFVHHSGKDEARGARGHSSLRAAVDTEIEISRADGADFSTVRVVKQREMSMDEDMFFGLEVVELGHNTYLEPVTSCVVKVVEEPIRKASKREMSPVQQFVYDTILGAVSYVGRDLFMGDEYKTQRVITYEDFRERLETRGFKNMFDQNGTDAKVKSATQAARLALKTMGKINFNRTHIWLVKKEEN